MIDDAEFARRIRMARAYLGLTLAEAGAKLDLSPSQLSRRENADENGMKLRTADRFHMAAVYGRMTGWPSGFFSDAKIPPLPAARLDEDGDLSPADVVDLVDRRDDDGETVSRL